MFWVCLTLHRDTIYEAKASKVFTCESVTTNVLGKNTLNTLHGQQNDIGQHTCFTAAALCLECTRARTNEAKSCIGGELIFQVFMKQPSIQVHAGRPMPVKTVLCDASACTLNCKT